MFQYEVDARVQCSAEGCTSAIDARLVFRSTADRARIIAVKLPGQSGWRVGRFVPGVLHPARGGVPQQGESYREPGLFIACPEHVQREDGGS